MTELEKFFQFMREKNYYFNLPDEGGSYTPSIEKVKKEFEETLKEK